MVTYAQLTNIEPLGSGQFSIAVAATITTADGNERQIAVKILKQSEKEEYLTDRTKKTYERAGVELKTR